MTTIKSWLGALAVTALAGIAHAQTQTPPQTQTQTPESKLPAVHSQFAGPYAGIKIGENWSNASGNVSIGTHGTTFFGAMAGYGFDFGRFVLGAEAFADFHNGSTTRKDAGIDARIGVPFNQIVSYARVGLTGSWPEYQVSWRFWRRICDL
jgi:outer membrane immunogenic protein